MMRLAGMKPRLNKLVLSPTHTKACHNVSFISDTLTHRHYSGYGKGTKHSETAAQNSC